MKYIRTKDGIYTLITKDNPIYELNGIKYYCVEERISSFSENEIIKQADTIEELCDEFVSITEDLKPEILDPKYISPRDTIEIAWKNRFEDEMCYRDVVIFGAIWTDKGLIYVAKMNEKGELVLL